MAFASLFSSLPNKELNTKPSDSRERFQQDEWQDESIKLDLENDKNAKFRKRPLERNLMTVCRNKNKKKAKKKKIYKDEPQSYKDFDDEARDYSMRKCDHEQPSFNYSEQLDNYSRNKAGDDMGNPEQKSGWKHPRPGEENDLGKKNKKGQRQKNEQLEQQRLDKKTRGRTGSSAERGSGFARWSGRGVDTSSRRGGRGSNRVEERGSRGHGRDKRSGFHPRDDWSKRSTDRSHRGGRLTLGSLAGTGKRNMTKEFKDQNAIEIDGRLICRHFLKGKCIKGEDCQLEHALDVNYTINEERMTDFLQTLKLTKQLLESALEQNKDGPKPEPEEPETVKDTQPVKDILLNPFRPNFYNSSSPCETNAEAIPLCQNGLSAKVTEMEIDCPSDSTLCPNAPLTSFGCKEPVSYSVEAMLGSHKPLDIPHCGVFSPSGSQRSTLQPTQAQPDVCLADLPLHSTHSKENVPCSIEATLGFHQPTQKPLKTFSDSVTETFTPLLTQTQSDPQSTTFVSTDQITSSDPHRNKTLAGSEEADFGPQKLVKKSFCNLFSGLIPQSSHHPTNSQQGSSCTELGPPGSDPSAGGKNLPLCSVKILPQPNNPMKKPFCSLSSGSPIRKVCNPPSQRSLNHPWIFPGSEGTASKKTENPFFRLFAGPISQTSTRQTRATLRNPPNTTFGASDSNKLLGPHTVCKKRASVEAVSESQTVTEKPFRSLFAAPLSQITTPSPFSQSSPGSALNQRGQKDSCSMEPLLERHKPLEKPFGSFFAGPNDTITPHPSQNLPDPPRAMAQHEVPNPKSISRLPVTTQTPVWKTLFLHLSPCHQEGEQWSSNGSNDPEKQSQEVDEVVVENIKEEVGEMVVRDIKEEVGEMVVQDIKEEVGEMVVRDIKEEVGEMVVQDIKEEVGEMVVQDIKEEVGEMVVQDIKEEVGEMVEEDIEEDVEDEFKSEPEECGLRVEPLVIPLEQLVHYRPLSDPRHPLHVNITLPRPTFSLDVVWSPEDLAPVPPLSLPHHPKPFVPRIAPPCGSLSGPAAGLEPQPTLQNINSHHTPGEHLTLSRCSGRSNVQVGTPGIHNLPVLAVVQRTQPKFDMQSKRLAGQMRSNSGNLSDRKTLKDLFKNLDPISPPFGQ
ncbi:hypothetical protein UPYG_G00066850 [Umbra pygmaea]|uniref:C3H1-type domain-containing protein n=1 Tax=Umbra pygmaea TaxID=75934 RepID=A0ABD0XDL7_UMBPY